MGITKIRATDCTTQFPYHNNHRFTCNSPLYNQVTGAIMFTPKPQIKISAPYHTRYGGTSTTTVVYRHTPQNLALALHRMTCVREPLIPGLCARLYRDQATNLPQISRALEQHALVYYTACGDYLGGFDEEEAHYADPHPKRAARINAHLTSVITGTRIPGPRLRFGRVVAGFKIERAKMGKRPRLVVDLGVEASLVGAWITKWYKHQQSSHPYIDQHTAVHFIPASTYSNLSAAFTYIQDPPRTYTALVYSDDAVLAIQQRGVTTWYNLDISSCDKSHGSALFQSFLECVPGPLRQEVGWLYSQLRAPMQVRSPGDMRQRFLIRPNHITMYSGTTLTTCVNTHALTLIIIAISRAMAITPAQIMAAAASIGYIVTCQHAPRLEQVQFLKYSPIRDVDGVYQPVLNLGVYLRSAGQVYGELPGCADIPRNTRAEHAHAALLKCMWPNTHFPMLTAGRDRYPNTTEKAMKAPTASLVHRVVGNWPTLRFTDESILTRYGLEQTDPIAIRNIFAGPLFYLYTGTDVDTVLRLDYDLTTNQTTTRLPPPPAEWIQPSL